MYDFIQNQTPEYITQKVTIVPPLIPASDREPLGTTTNHTDIAAISHCRLVMETELGYRITPKRAG